MKKLYSIPKAVAVTVGLNLLLLVVLFLFTKPIQREIGQAFLFLREGTMAAVREKGLLRSEGKEYTVADGDVIVFRFNV